MGADAFCRRAWVKSSGKAVGMGAMKRCRGRTGPPVRTCVVSKGSALAHRLLASELSVSKRCSTAFTILSPGWFFVSSFFFLSLDSEEPMSQLTSSSKNQLTQGAVGGFPNTSEPQPCQPFKQPRVCCLFLLFPLLFSWFSGSAALLFVDSPGTPAAQGSGRKKRERKS